MRSPLQLGLDEVGVRAAQVERVTPHGDPHEVANPAQHARSFIWLARLAAGCIPSLANAGTAAQGVLERSLSQASGVRMLEEALGPKPGS